MNDTPIPSDPLDKNSTRTPEESNASMLDTILADAKLDSAVAPTIPVSSPSESEKAPEKETPKKEKKPMDAVTFFRLTGAILLVTLIFFGSFLAYIVFNPDQALFFLRFGINLNDVKVLLAGLVNSIFGFVIVVLAIVWVIFLFRAIWTPRTLKKKKTLSTIGAIFIGIILFSLITLWAVLIGRINATDYENLEGSIVLYDNDLYKTPTFSADARLDSTQTIIGPITIFFDISANAKKIANRDLVNITRYDMNFDGAKCTNGLAQVGGTDPTDQTIICTFDQVKEYNLEGNYETEDRITGAKGVVSMELPPIKVVGLVAKSNTKNIEGKSIYTLDASSLRSFGVPNWILSDGPDPANPFVGGTRKTEASVTEVVDQEKKSFCLTFEGGTGCRIFIIEDVQSGIGSGNIRTIQDQTNPLSFTFEITDLSIDMKELTNIEWVVNGNTKICTSQTSLTCEYTFSKYGNYTLSAFVTDVNGDTEELRTIFQADELIELQRHVSVLSATGATLNGTSTYDRDLVAYVIPGLSLPSTITLDARDITATDSSYALGDVHWIISEGSTQTEKTGSRISVNITQEGRYEILGQYTFLKQGATGSGQTKMGSDKIIFDVGREELRPILLVYPHSDYAPVTITFDASPSEIQNGEIIKFIYDFGEGRMPVEGDAVQSYEYVTAGEKKVTLTIVSTTGEKSSTTETIILKDQQKKVVLNPSIDKGTVGNAVDWNVNGTIGNIEQTIWDFGDGSASSYDRQPSHIYSEAGTYTTTLKVRFTDGTVQEESYEFTVE